MGCKEAFVSTQTLRIGDPHRGLRHKLPTLPQSGPQGEIFAAKRFYGNLNTSFFIGENSIDFFSIQAENCHTDSLCPETNNKSHKPQHFVLAVAGSAKRDYFVHLCTKIILIIRSSAKLFRTHSIDAKTAERIRAVTVPLETYSRRGGYRLG